MRTVQSPGGRTMRARNSITRVPAAGSISVSGFGRRSRFAAVTIVGLRSSLAGAGGSGALAATAGPSNGTAFRFRGGRL